MEQNRVSGILHSSLSGKSRLNNLTVARFAAAFLVLFHHAKVLQNPAVIETDWLRNFFHNGYVGVTFFFILSGFVISLAHFHEFNHPRIRVSLSYFSKRLIRIVPLWLFLSLPFVLLGILKGDGRPLLSFLTFTQAWDPDLKVAYGYLSVAWTLSCEMFFYAMFPFIAWLLHRTQTLGKHAALVVAALCASISLVTAIYFFRDPIFSALPTANPDGPHRWLYRFPPMRLLEFATGVSLYVWFSSNSEALRSKKYKTPWLIVTGTSIVAIFGIMSYAEVNAINYTAAYLVPFAALVIGLTAIEVNESPVSITLPGLVLLGEASYALYLVHKEFNFPLTRLQDIAPISGFIWSSAFTIVISIGLYVAIERPSRKWLLERTKKVFSDRPEASWPGKQHAEK